MLIEREHGVKSEEEDAPIEPFVAPEQGAVFLGVTRRRILQLARAGEIPGHPIGRGKRKTWRFRLTELAHALDAQKPRESRESGSRTIIPGSPRSQRG